MEASPGVGGGLRPVRGWGGGKEDKRGGKVYLCARGFYNSPDRAAAHSFCTRST